MFIPLIWILENYFCYQGLLMNLPKRLGRYSGEFGCAPPPPTFSSQELFCVGGLESPRDAETIAGSHELGLDVSIYFQCKWGHKSQSYHLQRKIRGMVLYNYFFYHARSVRFSICRIRQVGLLCEPGWCIGVLLSVKPFPCLISLKRLLSILPDIKTE